MTDAEWSLLLKYLLLVIVVFSTIARSQSSRDQKTDTIYFKQDSVLCASIVSADSFAVYLADGNIVGLKVVDSLLLHNGMVAKHLQDLYPAVTIEERQTELLLSFNRVKIPRRIASDHKVMQQFSAMIFFYRHDDLSNLEGQLSFLLKGIDHIVFQFGFASALVFNDTHGTINPIYNTGATDKCVSDIQGFVGIGYTTAIQNYRVSLIVNIGEKRVANNFENLFSNFHLGIITFVSPYIERSIFDDHCMISIGSHVYLNKISGPGASSMGTFNFGCGYRF